jgi:hypothetical protein
MTCRLSGCQQGRICVETYRDKTRASACNRRESPQTVSQGTIQ